MKKKLSAAIAVLLSACLLAALPAGAQNIDKKKGAVAGAGVGAIFGQIIGKNTKSTLIGTAIGTGVGYIIGNEADKEKAGKLAEGAPEGTHNEVGSLGGTRWNLESLDVPGRENDYVSKVVEFKPNGRLLTTTSFGDGKVTTADEGYRVVDDILIVNKPGYLVNATFKVKGETMTVKTEEFTAVLKKMPL
jgi:hypothetical protein